MNFVAPWIYFFFVFVFILNVDARVRKINTFPVTDFGAVSDGKTDNKEAFANAWKKACETDGGIVLVPKGSFLLSGGVFEGSCNGQTHFQVAGTLKAFSNTDPSVMNQGFWLAFSKVNHLKLYGTGQFDGNGASTWSRCQRSSQCSNRPTTLKINYASNVLIRDTKLINSKMFHLNIYKSKNVTVEKVHIVAPEDSPNTDGIHIGSSNDVKIIDSHISTGDDCVSIGDGTRNVDVSGVRCGPGHGISIGSLGKYKGEKDVSGIRVSNCILTKTTNGLRIKTWAPSLSSNIVSDVTYSNIHLNDVHNPIIIDQYYCPTRSCHHDGESSVEIKGVKYKDIRGSSAAETAVKIQCSKWNKCSGVEFAKLDITFKGHPTTANCSSVEHHFLGSNQSPSSCS